jgi:hypothetical protein
MIKRLISLFAIILAAAGCRVDYPEVITIEGGRLHVQGIALDKAEECMYCSFTSAFFKTDLNGNIIGSITGINGHLGAMTFDPHGRKVYASLERKDDEIGRGISRTLGAEAYDKNESGFFIAEIDVDKITGMDIPFEDAIELHPVVDAVKDYLDTVEVDGKVLEHRYGCSGIDGITLGPAFGSKGRKPDHLYIAYGVYGDTTRIDNDHNILVCYSLKDLSKPVNKYFIHTGNTRYGVQNMAYDKASRKIYLAVYKGNKSQYPNYDLFSLDIDQLPYKAPLENVPYESENVEHLNYTEGWHFKWGSTGLCPLGDDRWYISENRKIDGVQVCQATIYHLSSSGDPVFTK